MELFRNGRIVFMIITRALFYDEKEVHGTQLRSVSIALNKLQRVHNAPRNAHIVVYLL